MEEFGVLTITIVIFTPSTEDHGRIRKTVLHRRHSCTRKEAEAQLRKFLRINEHLSLDHVEAQWQVAPHVFAVRDYTF